MSLTASEPYQRGRLGKVSVSEPTKQAITVDEARDFAKANNQPASEDTIFDILIGSATEAFESFTSKLIFTREVVATFYPDGKSLLKLPYGELKNITSVDGSDDYIQRHNGILVSSDTKVEVTYQGGLFTDESKVDSKIKLGLLKWIATNYNDRENTIVEDINEMPNGSKQQWLSYKEMSV